MRVAVLGAGSVGFGSAALLGQRGHLPVLWSPSGRGTAGLAGTLTARGAVEGAFAVAVAGSCAEAVAGADCVLIAVPGYAHRAVIGAAAACLRAGQVVLFSSHMSLAGAFLRRLCPAAPVVAWGTTAVTGRKTGEAEVWVTNVRAAVDVAVLPGGATEAGLAACRDAFGDRFVPRAGLAAISLSNLNPQNHLAIALCNLTRMERGETWKQYAHITPAVGRLMEALDAERLAAAAAYRVEVRSLHEHFRLSFGTEGDTVSAMAAQLAAGGKDPNGPATLATRYVTEDVPFGLWPTLCLARAAGVDMPLHAGGVALLSALYGRDFPGENDILPELGDVAACLRAEC